MVERLPRKTFNHGCTCGSAGLIIAVMLLQAVYWGAKSWKLMGHATVRLTAQLSYALYLYHPWQVGS